jgi:hypothetical protein
MDNLKNVIREVSTCTDLECKKIEEGFTVTSTLSPKDSKRYFTVRCNMLETLPETNDPEVVAIITRVIDSIAHLVFSNVDCEEVIETKIIFPNYVKFVRRCQANRVRSPRISMELLDSRYVPDDQIFHKHGEMASRRTRFKL